MSAEATVIGVFVIYLLSLAAVAFWARRESASVSGYYLAGKKLPPWVVAFSTNATGESGWLLLGLTGMGYAVGFHALWIVLGEVIGVSLSWLVIARRLKRATDADESLTVPDYLESRFPGPRHLLRLVAVGIILVMVTTYVSAQLVATGKAFAEFMPVGYTTGVLIGTIVTFAYTAVGGFKAVSYTDVIQGLLMLAGLIVVPVTAWTHAGGWAEVTRGLATLDPSLTHWLGAQGLSLAGFVAAVSFVTVGLPFLGVPQLLVRYMAIRDEVEVRTAASISIGCIFLYTFGAVMTGVAGRVLFPDLADPEVIFPTLARELFPPVVTGVLVVVVLAAIMSTVDSLFILASSAVTRDLVQRVFRPDLADRRVARLGRVVTVLLGLMAAGIALTDNRMIFWFVLFSWSGLGASFGPVVVMSLYSRKVTRAGALAGMLGGFLTTVVWVLLLKEPSLGLYEAIPGYAVGFLLTWAVSRSSRRQDSGPV